MINDAEQNDEISQSRRLMFEQIDFFKGKGFEFQSEKLSHSSLVGNSIDFRFYKKDNKITMDVIYNPTLNNNRRSFILNLRKEGMQDEIYLEQFLRIRARDEFLACFTDEGRALDLKEFWMNFFKMLDCVFAEDLKESVYGKEWAGQKFDWEGYR
ncbi:MAG: hypothetical protein QM790_19910 [Nibricoccus sp.]